MLLRDRELGQSCVLQDARHGLRDQLLRRSSAFSARIRFTSGDQAALGSSRESQPDPKDMESREP
ncbi:hypothetical protein O9K51_05284 [Purpureocillium lavendulum]|uniref:Uncharacterized protein n=1 Tax=Purpureocillium lavendulum TaxID=1247861 RepID=A0AB34FQC2_9HYPO|nr:hypothetical protein O9K51_05284 [Purpureocillium lavendulum]